MKHTTQSREGTMRLDNRWEQVDQAALHNALLALKTCPRCRADLQPVGPGLADVWGCSECKETWYIPTEETK